jgi:hypothetical protein
MLEDGWMGLMADILHDVRVKGHLRRCSGEQASGPAEGSPTDSCPTGRLVSDFEEHPVGCLVPALLINWSSRVKCSARFHVSSSGSAEWVVVP